MFKNFKIATKLNLLLMGILITLTITIGLILSQLMNSHAQQIISERAALLMQTMSSVRNYTSSQIRPELAARLESEEKFIPQTVPAYSAREIFNDLRQNNDYKKFFYKEATINPTNLVDKADDFETQVVQALKNTQSSQLTGFRTTPSGDMFYIARPLAVTKESCLECHSTPERAPRSQIATYGDKNGFNWKLNEIVGAQMISVPASQVINDANKLTSIVVGTVLACLFAATLLLNIFLKLTIVKPINHLSKLTRQASTGELNVEFKHPNNDEIGTLTSSFNRMKRSLTVALDLIDDC